MDWLPTFDNDGTETGRVNLDRVVRLRAAGDGTSWNVFADLTADLGGTPAVLALGLKSREEALAFIAKATTGRPGQRAESPTRKGR